MPRPVRMYLHTFVNGDAPAVRIARTGTTPCEAKNKAFLQLEQEIVTHGLPPAGWRLQLQQDITHTLQPSPRPPV